MLPVVLAQVDPFDRSSHQGEDPFGKAVRLTDDGDHRAIVIGIEAQIDHLSPRSGDGSSDILDHLSPASLADVGDALDDAIPHLPLLRRRAR